MSDVVVSNSIVGQQYENRKTHKMGVVERVEDKYKTILFRDSEGKSFNINFSTFKSSWRKYKGEEVVKTSSQVTAEKAEQKKAVEAEKRAEKNPKKKADVAASKAYIAKIAKLVEPLITEPYKMITTSRGGIKIKLNRRIMFELWPHVSTESMSLLVSDKLWDAVNKYDNKEIDFNPEYTHHPTYKVPHELQITTEYLKFYVDTTLQALNTINTEKEESENA